MSRQRERHTDIRERERKRGRKETASPDDENFYKMKAITFDLLVMVKSNYLNCLHAESKQNS